MFIHMYVYVRAKKIIQREGEIWHKRGGGGVYGLKQPSMLDYLKIDGLGDKKKGTLSAFK